MEIVDLRKNTVLVSLIVGLDGWDRMISLEKRKALEKSREQTKKAETKLRDLSEQAQGAAPLPEVIESQPLKDLSPSQTKSQPLLYFIIYEAKKSIYKYNDVEIARCSGVLTKR